MRQGHAIVLYLLKEETDWIEIMLDWMAADYKKQDWCEMAVIILINF